MSANSTLYNQVSKLYTVLYLVWIHWKLTQAPANIIFYVYRWFHLNFLEQLPLVEQYNVVNISSTWLDLKQVIGKQRDSHDLFLILWRLLRYDKSTSSWVMREKGKDLTQSYDKSPSRNVERAKWQHKQRHKKVWLHSDCRPTKDGQLE